MTTHPQYRPLLMSGPLVVASLAGLKTQTRRVCNPQPGDWIEHGSRGVIPLTPGPGSVRASVCDLVCPYGKPGDRLWVREKFKIDTDGNRQWLVYAADGKQVPCTNVSHAEAVAHGDPVKGIYWRPSIFMRREWSRLTLEIIEVRVQRVREISEEDAAAEGCVPVSPSHDLWRYRASDDITGMTARECFGKLWDSINLKRGYGWDSNCWTWALTYKVVSPALGAEGGGG